MRRSRVMLECFHPRPNSAGFYLARERGGYREQGLELAAFPSKRLLVRRAQGEPLQAVAAIDPCGLEAIQTLAGTGIEHLRDLAGRRLALNPTPRGRAMARQRVARDGGDPEAVQPVDTGVRELRPENLQAGVADASFGGYWTREALMDSRVDPDARMVWPVQRLGAPAYHSYLLGARARTLAARPAWPPAFVAVTARGFLAAAPLQALDAYERATPYPVGAAGRLAAGDRADLAAPGRWGEPRRSLLEGYAQWLAAHGMLSDAKVWRDAVDPGCLPRGSA